MQKHVAIIGGGPAGLMAAEILSAQGVRVSIYERKPSVGRKFLMAGRGGLNLTHSEDLGRFISRYGPRAPVLDAVLRAFPPQALRDWSDHLGEKTFIGSSGRVFPESFKASPLLRAWIARLEQQGVVFHLGHDWQGWDADSLVFQTSENIVRAEASATLLALGGASWPRLGSDGGWVDILKQAGVAIAPLKPANCGFSVAWSPVFSQKFAGQPIKAVGVSFNGARVMGEIGVTAQGLEGGAIYALSRVIRDTHEAGLPAVIMLDLKADLDAAAVEARLSKPRGRESLSNHLRKTLKLSSMAIGLIMETKERAKLGTYTPAQLAHLIKNYPIALGAPFPLERAISTAGGVLFEALDQNGMLIAKPGIFAAGEMLDWEAPTGGYLLQASMATGVYAARGILNWLDVLPGAPAG